MGFEVRGRLTHRRGDANNRNTDQPKAGLQTHGDQRGRGAPWQNRWQLLPSPSDHSPVPPPLAPLADRPLGIAPIVREGQQGQAGTRGRPAAPPCCPRKWPFPRPPKSGQTHGLASWGPTTCLQPTRGLGAWTVIDIGGMLRSAHWLVRNAPGRRQNPPGANHFTRRCWLRPTLCACSPAKSWWHTKRQPAGAAVQPQQPPATCCSGDCLHSILHLPHFPLKAAKLLLHVGTVGSKRGNDERNPAAPAASGARPLPAGRHPGGHKEEQHARRCTRCTRRGQAGQAVVSQGGQSAWGAGSSGGHGGPQGPRGR